MSIEPRHVWLAFDVRIHYPFHPRRGQLVSVMFRRRFAGEDHLVVVQPDGTLALIPSWMSDETAASAIITATPRLSVSRLLELRTRLDALLACSRGESAPPAQRGDHASRTQRAKRFVRTGSADPGDSNLIEAGDHPPDREPSDGGRRCGRSADAIRGSGDNGGCS